MPFVNLKLIGKLSKKQKEQIVSGITKLLEDIARKPAEATYIVIEEVKSDNWAKGGKLLSG